MLLNLAVGQETGDIPLFLEPDVPFRWRGIDVTGPLNFGIRLKDPDGNWLSDDYVPLEVYSGYPGAAPGQPGAAPVPLDLDIPCPAAGVVYLKVKRLS